MVGRFIIEKSREKTAVYFILSNNQYVSEELQK